jgi:hypothetical protein
MNLPATAWSHRFATLNKLRHTTEAASLVSAAAWRRITGLIACEKGVFEGKWRITLAARNAPFHWPCALFTVWVKKIQLLVRAFPA